MNRSHIYNLRELDRALKNKCSKQSYAHILKSIRFNFKEVEHLCFWDAEDYCKINIGNGVNYELVLICWEANQCSKIHKHEGEETLTYILKGELTEDIYADLEQEKTPDQSIVLSRSAISSLLAQEEKEHWLTNSYSGRSVSMHLYIK